MGRPVRPPWTPSGATTGVRWWWRRVLLLTAIPWLCRLPGSAAAARGNATAVVFGATGAVGNEVLRAVVEEAWFETVIVVGRRPFPAKVTGVLPETAVAVVVEDLASVGEHQALPPRADACFVATGSGFPHLSDWHDWHHAEVVVTTSIAGLCGRMGAASLSVFTSVDAEDSPEDLPPGALVPTGVPLGWWPVLANTLRVMGLKERAVVGSAAGTIPSIRIFRPSSLRTKEHRYGWLQTLFFGFHDLFDERLPPRYHSVTTGDAVRILSSGKSTHDDDDGVARLEYQDFLQIVRNHGTEPEPPERAEL